MELIRDTIARFKNAFDCEPELVITAPGRVNLLGEHTDYNEGFVLPVAIDRRIILAISLRDDEEVHLHAVDLLRTVKTSLKAIRFNSDNLWVNYPLGVLWMFMKRGVRLQGMNISFRGTIPMGTGLSSSAAIEVACALAISQALHLSISTIELINLARQSEVEFVGVNCGVMDQFVSIMGKKHNAVFLDCRSLQHDYIHCPPGLKLVVCDTGIRRELAHTEYNRRILECRIAAEYFSKKNPGVTSLRDVSIDDFLRWGQGLDLVIRNRAKHVIYENDRVRKGAEALQRCDLSEFGKLMIDSHVSLRDCYEVSCNELDEFVDLAITVEGVYGARMTGAGFGGCGICLVDEQKIENLVDHLREEFPKVAGRSLTIYIASVEDGAKIYHPMDLSAPRLAAG